MNKLLHFALCIGILLSLTGCNNLTKSDKTSHSDNTTPSSTHKEPIESISLETETHYILEKLVDFSLFKIHTTDRIFASMGGNNYYPNDQKDETYIDVILDWTNLSTGDVDVSKGITLSAVNNKGTEYTRAFYSVETDNGTNLSQFKKIAAQTTARIHCALSIPKAETNLTLKLKIKDHEYTCAYTMGTIIHTAQSLTLDEIIDVPGHAAFTLKRCEYTDDVCPSQTDNGYAHYTIDDEANTYLALQFDITNHAETDKDIDSFVNISALYRGQPAYTGFTVVEEEDGRGFDTYADILSHSTRHLYHLIEVPKTMTENEVVITITFYGKEYIYTM